MIPKIIHQTWKNAEVPAEFAPYQNKVRALNPGWQYRLWTDDENLKFVEQEFSDFLEIYLGFPRHIMRVDVIRYLIMYKVGGVYLDLDYEVLKPFDFPDHEVVLPLNRQRSFGDSFDGLGNCIFASVPGHRFWKLVMEDLKRDRDYSTKLQRLRKKPYVQRRTTMEEVSTGPQLLSRIYFDNRDVLTGVFTPDRALFHPPTPRRERQYRRIVSEGVAYGIHHCRGTWR